MITDNLEGIGLESPAATGRKHQVDLWIGRDAYPKSFSQKISRKKATVIPAPGQVVSEC